MIITKSYSWAEHTAASCSFLDESRYVRKKIAILRPDYMKCSYRDNDNLIDLVGQLTVTGTNIKLIQ